MPLPTFVTSQNVKFDGTTTNSVVLRNAVGVRTLIKWDALSAADQLVLTQFINANGGVTPIVTPTSGYATLSFNGTVVGSNATGLSAVAAVTAGYATINLGGTAVAGSPSGLSSAAGTNGYQVVNYQPGITGATSTGIPAATAGYQVIHFSVAKTGAAVTGIANDATVHTATITVDGVAKTVSAAGTALQTFTAVVATINTGLGSAGTAALVSGDIKITSATSGASSSVVSVTGTLFGALNDFSVIQASVPGTGSVANLTATITIDGVAKAVSVAPGSAATFGAVVTAISSAIGAAGTAAIVGGDIRITSATSGVTSRVVIAPGTLFPILAGYVSTLPPAPGGGAARNYSFTLVVDDTKYVTVAFTGILGNTFQHVVDQINADVGAIATAAIVGGNIKITSATTGTTSSVIIRDTGFLVNSLTGRVGVSSVLGTAPSTYTATVTVDGTVKNVSVVGSAALTFTTLVAELNTDLGASATAAIVGGNIVITSASTGTSSSITVQDGNLFRSVTGFDQIGAHVKGAADMLTAMRATKTPAGGALIDAFSVDVVGAKPAVPSNVKHTLAFTYYDGTDWKYLDDDTTV